MKVNEKLHQMGIDPSAADFSDILAALDTPDSLTLKKDEIGTDLVSLVAFADTSRSSLAEILDYKKSRITRILSGMENLTLRTIHDVCKAVGYEFDITFRKKSEAKPLQPWQTVETFFEKPVSGNFIQITSKTVTTSNQVVNFAPQSGANDATWNFYEPLKLAAA